MLPRIVCPSGPPLQVKRWFHCAFSRGRIESAQPRPSKLRNPAVAGDHVASLTYKEGIVTFSPSSTTTHRRVGNISS